MFCAEKAENGNIVKEMHPVCKENFAGSIMCQVCQSFAQNVAALVPDKESGSRT